MFLNYIYTLGNKSRMRFRSNIKEVVPCLSSFCMSSIMDWLQKQLHWWFPGVALKKCHWISIWAFSLLRLPTGALKAGCAGLSTKPCSWCAFTTPLFRMRNVKILHLPLFLLCARVCLGESPFCDGSSINVHQIHFSCFYKWIHSWLGLLSSAHTVVKFVNAVLIYLYLFTTLVSKVINRYWVLEFEPLLLSYSKCSVHSVLRGWRNQPVIPA